MTKAPLAECDICTLKDNIFVPSEYHEGAKVILLAEAPGFNETKGDAEGNKRPLIGVAGQDLDKIIASAGANRSMFNLLNTCCCRPVKIVEGSTYNRTPTDAEIKWCNARLKAEIDSLHPYAIVTLGQTPYKALGGKVSTGFRMRDIVGKTFVYEGKYDVISTYHPAAYGYAGGGKTEYGREIGEDIKKAIVTALAVKPKSRQLSLF